MICALPRRLALRLGRGFALFWYYVVPVRRAVARKNVQRVFRDTLTPRQQRQIVRQCFENLGMYGIEALRLPAMTPELSRELVECVNLEAIFAGLEKGRGVIAPTAHIGNWDLFGCSQAILGVPLNVIVKDIHWKPGHDFVFSVRDRCGFKCIPPRQSKELILKALRRNEVVAIISDQHMPAHRGIVCEFFGQLASTSPAVARFGFESGAVIHPAVCFRRTKDGHHVARVEQEFVLETPHDSLEANVRHNTQRLNRIIEGWILEAPEQWLWLHKRWKVHDNPQAWSIPQELQNLVRGA